MITTYITDIHGEFEGFTHAMRTGSGVLYSLVDEVLGDELSVQARDALATFVAFPQEKMHIELRKMSDAEKDAWFAEKISQLEALCEHLSLAQNCAEFVSEQVRRAQALNLQDRAEALCNLIKKIMTGKLFVLGDIYDRGPAPERVIDELKECDDVHILWGNHDMAWIGAAAAHPACVATVVRICARYSNLDTLTRAYHINIDPLVNFANSAYKQDPCAGFALRVEPDAATREQIEELMRVQKAIAIIQFKIEKNAIDENPVFNLSDRKLLHLIDYDSHTIMLDGQKYELKDALFPTVDPRDPYKLTLEEQAIIDYLCEQFTNSARLQDHIRYLLRAGSLYIIYDNDLLLHACVPINSDGTLKAVKLFDKEYSGRALFDVMDGYVRDAFFATDEKARARGRNIIWYLWLGAGSPLFAKSKMATFEMYFVKDKSTHKEVKNAFYSLCKSDVSVHEIEEKLNVIFEDFSLDPHDNPHIICGHVPIKYTRGESPVKCDGKLLMIDGGLSHAYQPTSGIGGFTLVKSNESLTLNALEPLPSTLQEIIEHNTRTRANSRIIETF